jgi:prepilin-type N-terminal cleavage/methylation domain-containing protein
VPRLVHPTKHRARGFTLLEVMLVVAIVVVVAGLTWPLLERPIAYERLKSAADKVRATWVRARINAQTSGEPYVFTVLSEDEYEICQRSLGLNPDAGLGLTPDGGREVTLRFDEDPSEQRSGDLSEGRLPDGVTFDLEESYASPETAAAGLADTSATGIFSVTFYPDGTADDLSLAGAGLVLKNKYGHRVLLQLRGLTGAPSISDLEDDESAPEAAVPVKGDKDDE